MKNCFHLSSHVNFNTVRVGTIVGKKYSDFSPIFTRNFGFISLVIFFFVFSPFIGIRFIVKFFTKNAELETFISSYLLSSDKHLRSCPGVLQQTCSFCSPTPQNIFASKLNDHLVSKYWRQNIIFCFKFNTAFYITFPFSSQTSLVAGNPQQQCQLTVSSGIPQILAGFY